MTTKVTKESLAENIGRLESYGDLSINEEYQLKAYRLLLEAMQQKPLCHLTWHQGFRAPDDCEEYVIEAKPGDLSCDGSPAFAVFGNRMFIND